MYVIMKEVCFMFKKIIISLLLLTALMFGIVYPTEAAAEGDLNNGAFSSQAEAVRTSFRISSSRINLGERVVIRLRRASSSEKYLVSYYVRSSPTASWKRIVNGENKYAVSFLPQKSLYYQFKATAKGTDGKTITSTFTVAVVKDTGKPLMIAPKENPVSITLGSSVKLKTTLSSGVTPYRYSFSYCVNGGKWKSLIKNSKLSYYKLTPKKAGYYTIAYYGKDSSGKLVQKQKELVVTNATGEALTNTTKTAESKALGTKLTIKASATGGTAPYKYEAYYSDPVTKEKTLIREPDKNETIKFAPEKAGTYNITVNVYDYNANMSTAVLPVTFYEETGEELTVEALDYPSDTIAAGSEAVFRVSAFGGAAPYNYQTFIRKFGGDWKAVDENNDISSCSQVIAEAGYYEVRTVVTDALGEQQEISKAFAAESKTMRPLENRSLIVNNLITTGSELKVIGAAEGGYAPYTFEYYYRRLEANGWTRINRDPRVNECTCLINTTGLFEFRIVVTDLEGKKEERIIRYNVVKDTGKPLKSQSAVSATLLQVGDIIGLEAKPSGGAEPYSYFYSTAYDDGQMTYIGSSRFSSKQYYRLPNAGKYTMRITVQDGRGKTVTKDITVYASTNEWLDVLNSCDVMEYPLWASKCVGRVYSGTRAQLIQKKGNWYLVSCGDCVGWVYNMSFTNTGNYSSINKENLPVIADDIIFTKGRDIRSLYNYVYYMSYSTDNKQPLEDLCVFMLRYRRGACYHRAALLYYLLDRAGYEVYCIDDGIDKLTGNSPHNWVIVKTDEGYRHIDATPFSFMDSFYLATDNEVDPAFSWDREKYPACI